MAADVIFNLFPMILVPYSFTIGANRQKTFQYLNSPDQPSRQNDFKSDGHHKDNQLK